MRRAPGRRRESRKALAKDPFRNKKLPRLTAPIPIVCAGGTTMAGNFLAKVKAVVAETELPVRISGVYLAKDPCNATAKGALVGALLNM